MGKLSFIVGIVCALPFACLARSFTKCGLAHTLENAMMPRADIKNFVCIAEEASAFRPLNVRHTPQGETFGLFGILGKTWCDDDTGFSANECNMHCADLLDHDLSDDVACIPKIIKAREVWDGMGTGLRAWKEFATVCQYIDLIEYMAECWDNITITDLFNETVTETYDPLTLSPDMELPQIGLLPLAHTINAREEPSQDTTEEKESTQNEGASENEEKDETKEDSPANSDPKTDQTAVVYTARGHTEHQPLSYIQQMVHPQIYQRSYSV